MSVPGAAMLARVKRMRVGAEFLVELDGIDAGALGLRHLLAFGGAHQRMQVNLAEGNLRPVNFRPIMIMRATQKNRMS